MLLLSVILYIIIQKHNHLTLILYRTLLYSKPYKEETG